jgi:hypothetical protein
MSKTQNEINKLEKKINFLKNKGLKLEQENIKYTLISSSHIVFFPKNIKEIDKITNMFKPTDNKELFTKNTSIKSDDFLVTSPFSFNVENGTIFKKSQLNIKYVDVENRSISIKLDFDIFYNYFINFELVTSNEVLKKVIKNGISISVFDFIEEYMNIGKTIKYIGNSFTTVAVTEEQADIYNTLMGIN